MRSSRINGIMSMYKNHCYPHHGLMPVRQAGPMLIYCQLFSMVVPIYVIIGTLMHSNVSNLSEESYYCCKDSEVNVTKKVSRAKTKATKTYFELRIAL